MNNRSVQTKITVWITLLMLALFILLLFFMLFISSAVTMQTAKDQLAATLRANVAQIYYRQGELVTETNFSYYHNGVSTLIYSKGEALLAGQIPLAFSTDEPFQNGELRLIVSGQDQYLLLDLWVADGWQDGVWLRGLLEVPERRQTAWNLLRIAFIALPLFLVLTALGGYRIVRRAFHPLEAINAAAAAIGEAKDLSLRIDLPPGKDEFSRLAATFDQLFARLEKSFEAEKQFIADVSHELRTPVAIIKGACECGVKYDETPEERQETLAIIQRQAAKMSDLIAQLLRLTRLEQGAESAALEPVDLAELVERLIREGDYAAKGIKLQCAAGINVMADEALLARLLENLIGNAFKYGKPGGNVWVAVWRAGEEGLLQVRDDGIGISPEQQDKIWGRFYQVDPARSSEQEGIGLGLAMVKQIAQIHGGYMTLESIPEVGSAFTLHLPLLQTVPAASGEKK